VASRLGGTSQMTKLATIWQPLVRHRSVLLGALLIGAVWITLSFFLANERNSAERAAIQNSTNLAGALASHLSNSLGEVDRSLTVIAALYAQDPKILTCWVRSRPTDPFRTRYPE
jgi:hypothetical protein